MMEMVKYQTTSDIFGISFSGKRSDSDYQTSFVMHDSIKKIEKDAQRSFIVEQEAKALFQKA